MRLIHRKIHPVKKSFRLESQLVSINRSDMHRWLAAFPDPSVQDDEERIYEDFGKEDAHSTPPHPPSVFCTDPY